MSADPTQERSAPSTRRRIRRRSKKVIPILIIALAAGFVLKEQIPAVDSSINRLLQPEAWQVTQACKQAAIAAVERPEFARILKGGEANRTQKGYYVNGVVVGEMGANGTEVRSRFSCYVDTDGNVVNAQRQP